MTNNIFIISGPSGAGEDSVIAELKKDLDIEKIVTTTTRMMRPGEIDGRDYYFISKEEFEKGISNGDFFELAKEYNDNFYGVTNSEIERVKKSGKVGIWKIEYKGVIYAKEKIPNIVAIFINAESLEILEARIRRRDNVTEEYIKERIEYTKEWIKHLDIYDYRVINKENKLDEAVAEIKQIIVSELKKDTK